MKLQSKRNISKTSSFHEKERLATEKSIERAMRGDQKALRDLCRRIARGVFIRARQLLINAHDAEDVAQETLIRVCNKIQDLRDPKAFNGWLNSIVLNEAKRQIKKNAEQCNVAYRDDCLDFAAEECEEYLPHEHTSKAEESKVMMEIIATLPSRQREAIILHYYGGLSVTEVAAAMSIPHQSVSLYLKLARKKMREELLRRREQSEQPERCQRAKQPEQSRRSEQDEKPNPPKNIKLGTASTALTEPLVRSRLPYLAVDQQTNPLTSVSTAYLLWQRPWCAPLTSRSLLNSISTKTFRSY